MKLFNFKGLVFLSLLFFSTTQLLAVDRYWVAGASANWNNTANWSATSGGVGGLSVPLATDDVYFDSNGLGDCTIDIAVSIVGFSIDGYVGTVDLAGFSFLCTGDVDLQSGTINDTPGTSKFEVNNAGSTTIEGTTFGAIVDVVSASLYLNDGSTFNATSSFEKTGATTDHGSGGSTYVGNCVIINSGAGLLRLENVAGNTDVFSGNLLFNNTGSGYLHLGRSGLVTVAGDLVINNTGLGATARVTLARYGGSSVTIDGDLTLTQDGSATDLSAYLGGLGGLLVKGNTTVTNAGTGTDVSEVYLGREGSATFKGTIDVTNSSVSNASETRFNYSATASNTYEGNITLKSTNIANDGFSFGRSTGTGLLTAGNTVSIPGGSANFVGGELYFRNFTQTGATAQTLELASTATYIYNYDNNWGGNVDFKAPRINTRGTTYQGTAVLEKTGAVVDVFEGGNIFKGNTIITNSGSRFLRTGHLVGDAFEANLSLVVKGTSSLFFAMNTVNNVNGDLNVTVSTLANGSLYLARESTASVTVGGNTTVTNLGVNTTSRVYLGDAGDMVFNGDLSIVNNSSAGSSRVYCNNKATSSNSYNGNITVQSLDINSDGVFFGNSQGTGTLALTKTISIPGGSANFIGGRLLFRNFTQLGATPQTLELAQTAIELYSYDSRWEGDITFKSRLAPIRTSVFVGTADISKTGSGNSNSYGGNTFEENATFTHSGTNRWRLGNDLGDDYNGDVTFVRTGGGTFEPAYNQGNTFAGDINVNTNGAIVLARGSGTVELDGTTAQSINDLGASVKLNVERLVVHNPNDEVTLNMPIDVLNALTMTQGNINTTATNLLTVMNTATTSGASDDSFVDGPMMKKGSDAFEFPVGDQGIWAPIEIANLSGTDDFTAQYNFVDHGTKMNVDASLVLKYVSAIEYWDLDRAGTRTADVTLHWKNATRSEINNNADLVMAHNRASGDGKWESLGGSGVGGAVGSLTVNGVNDFSPFTFGSLTIDVGTNPLPVEFLSFKAVYQDGVVQLGWQTATERDNDYFVIEKSTDLKNFVRVAKVAGAGTSTAVIAYEMRDEEPYEGVSYYRIKQVDFNDELTYSTIEVVKNNDKVDFVVYPNPAKHIVFVDMHEMEGLELNLTNVVGYMFDVPVEVSTKQLQLDVSALKSDVYILRITYLGGFYTTKVVIE